MKKSFLEVLISIFCPWNDTIAKLKADVEYLKEKLFEKKAMLKDKDDEIWRQASVIIELRKVNDDLKKQLSEVTEDASKIGYVIEDVPLSEKVLDVIREHNGSVGLSKIAKELKTSPNVILETVEALEADNRAVLIPRGFGFTVKLGEEK